MDLFEIQTQSDLQKTFHQLFHKRISISNYQNNYKIYRFDKCFTKRCKSLFKNFTIPFQLINQFDNQQLISSCECLDCGGKVKKKIIICKKELIESPQSNIKSKFPASPQLSIQPQNMRPSNRDLSLIGSSAHLSIIFYLFLCEKQSKQSIKKSNRVSILPVIQLIKAQNLMKKISVTRRFEKDTKISTQNDSLFNKIQQKMITSKDQDHNKLKSVLEIEIKNKKEVVNNQYMHTRIKTEASNYYFALNNNKKSILNNIPNLSHLENIKKNSLSNLESKTPRILLSRSEKYNQKQSLSQRLMCTYLKKQNLNYKQQKNINTDVKIF
ncbi:unnamed protein product [Paramecium sonneborni]|uniref:Uncharacterized protein n=1 Tax=Paramecium sonneborni TaxID=65129 RepID=A0A8S1L5N0_9CILI|nr:unnamed protein product [Paramecium sonneborni]